jgi:apolipoprotein D and lipocalin family protein
MMAIALLALAACGAPAPQPTGSWRDAETRIASLALFDPTRIDGHWLEVAGYPLRQGCAPGAWTFSQRGYAAAGRGCYLPLAARQSLRRAGPGRWHAGGIDLWVLWADADYRTLVLGSPDGSFAAVLNRDGPIAADRLQAAERVLAFNGYDLARLQVR